MPRILAAIAAAALLALPLGGGAAVAQDAPEVVDMSMGDPDAPVQMIEYASFTCPHCRAFHEDVFGDLKADYIDTGKVRFIYREVYFDRPGLWAAMVARCAGPVRYFGVVDLLFDGQREWAAPRDPVEIAENLRKIGRTAGLSDEELNACMTDADMAQAMVDTYQKNAEADAISGTPSFIINGELHSNMTYEELKKILDAAAAG